MDSVTVEQLSLFEHEEAEGERNEPDLPDKPKPGAVWRSYDI